LPRSPPASPQKRWRKGRGERKERSEDDMRGPRGPTIFNYFVCVANKWARSFYYFLGLNCHVNATWDKDVVKPTT
jgi:hypothetical protein